MEPVEPKAIIASLSESPIETILLVEGEDLLRIMGRIALERTGYTVLGASRGGEAVRLSEGDRPIHLLITNVELVDMRGRTLLDHLVRCRPHLKVLYMDRVSSDAFNRLEELETPSIVIPFRPSQLVAKVREVLDEVL